MQILGYLCGGRSVEMWAAVFRHRWKRVSKEYRSFAHGLRDPLASLDQGKFLIEAVRTQCQLPNIRMAE